jgi:VWA domain-containing protein
VRAARTKPSGLYHTAARARNFPQLILYKHLLTYTQGMLRQRAFVALFLGAALWAGAAAAPHAQRPNARERSLYVSVVDQNGAPVEGLGESDFLVKEDNVTREVVRVVPAQEPMQIALLVDTSAAVRDDVSHIRQALPPFVAEMAKPNAGGRKNEIAVIGIGERPTILSEYSTDPAQVRKGIDRIWAAPGSGMYLLDAIVEVSQGLRKRGAARPVIIAILTAGTEYSNRHHDQVIDPLKDIGAAFYALAIGQPDTGLSPESRERAIVLDEGPRATGGTHEQLLTSMALAPRLAQLARQLSSQYKVTYGHPESLIPPERITVAASRPGLVARGTPVKEDETR